MSSHLNVHKSFASHQYSHMGLVFIRGIVTGDLCRRSQEADVCERLRRRPMSTTSNDTSCSNVTWPKSPLRDSMDAFVQEMWKTRYAAVFIKRGERRDWLWTLIPDPDLICVRCGGCSWDSKFRDLIGSDSGSNSVILYNSFVRNATVETLNSIERSVFERPCDVILATYNDQIYTRSLLYQQPSLIRNSSQTSVLENASCLTPSNRWIWPTSWLLSNTWLCNASN